MSQQELLSGKRKKKLCVPVVGVVTKNPFFREWFQLILATFYWYMCADVALLCKASKMSSYWIIGHLYMATLKYIKGRKIIELEI